MIVHEFTEALEIRHLELKILRDKQYTLPWIHFFLIHKILVLGRGFTEYQWYPRDSSD